MDNSILFLKAVGLVLLSMVVWMAAPILAALAVPAVLIAGTYQFLVLKDNQKPKSNKKKKKHKKGYMKSFK